MFYIEVDIAKHKHEASIISSGGRPLYENISFSNTQKGCEKLLGLMQKLTVTAGNCIIGMETWIITGYPYIPIC